MNKWRVNREKILFSLLSLLIFAFLMYFLFYPQKSEQESPGPSGGLTSPSPSVEMPSLSEVAKEQVIQGEIRLSPDLEKRVKKDAVLFVMAKLEGADEGPPIAVTRIMVSTFPVPYTLSLTHGMMENSEDIAGRKVRVSARLDQDGDASTRQPGDLIGFYPEPVAMGSSGVSFVLNQEIPSEKQ